MHSRRIAAIVAAGAVAATGTGVAVATTRGDDAKQREQSVLADAAKRLGTSPDKLREALGAAEDAQLEADVKAGRLTQEQADAIKRRRAEAGTVLGRPGRGWRGRPHRPWMGRGRFGPGGPGRGGPGDLMAAAAKALGLTEPKLFERLGSGESLAAIAKAQGKSLDDVEAAVKAAVKRDLDAAVKAGRLTQTRADAILARITERIDAFGLPGRRGLLGLHHG